MTESPSPSPPAQIVAHAGRYYRNARYLIFLLCVGFGIWCIRDGFFLWPSQNEKALQEAIREREQALGRSLSESERQQTRQQTKLPHTELDIIFNQVLGVALPPLAVLLVAWTLYNSRGAYRLAGDVLHIPGHPPIPLSTICRVDRRQWDRKGKALIEYEIPGLPGRRRFVLDDFVYERKPTDDIFEIIESRAPAITDGKDAG